MVNYFGPLAQEGGRTEVLATVRLVTHLHPSPMLVPVPVRLCQLSLPVSTWVILKPCRVVLVHVLQCLAPCALYGTPPLQFYCIQYSMVHSVRNAGQGRAVRGSKLATVFVRAFGAAWRGLRSIRFASSWSWVLLGSCSLLVLLQLVMPSFSSSATAVTVTMTATRAAAAGSVAAVKLKSDL